MFFNPQPLFVIIGYPNSGKKKMLQELFERKHFFPMKEPFLPAVFSNRFVVVNRTNRRHTSSALCVHISQVLHRHTLSAPACMVMLSFILDQGERDIRKVLPYLEDSGCRLHYLVLAGSWSDKRFIGEQDLEFLKTGIKRGRIHYFDLLVTRSPPRFQQRTIAVAQVIRAVLDGSCR
ncbi:hypothetical protein DF182_13380 [Chitinophaga flava]|uniref:Uncharacterized protein n=2 Tax=Chitinophaga flava TaxID=2259036 RepID=A0A365Y4S1_9BACT|nr:hypothetical protein DF182_13380 [Chitinophaga flava]